MDIITDIGFPNGPSNFQLLSRNSQYRIAPSFTTHTTLISEETTLSLSSTRINPSRNFVCDLVSIHEDRFFITGPGNVAGPSDLFNTYDYSVAPPRLVHQNSTSFFGGTNGNTCLLYTSPSPRDRQKSRMPSSA